MADRDTKQIDLESLYRLHGEVRAGLSNISHKITLQIQRHYRNLLSLGVRAVRDSLDECMKKGGK